MRHPREIVRRRLPKPFATICWQAVTVSDVHIAACSVWVIAHRACSNPRPPLYTAHALSNITAGPRSRATHMPECGIVAYCRAPRHARPCVYDDTTRDPSGKTMKSPVAHYCTLALPRAKSTYMRRAPRSPRGTRYEDADWAPTSCPDNHVSWRIGVDQG